MGCGVGVGYGFGAGLMLKPGVAERWGTVATERFHGVAQSVVEKLAGSPLAATVESVAPGALAGGLAALSPAVGAASPAGESLLYRVKPSPRSLFLSRLD
jgi:hypothetical protein